MSSRSLSIRSTFRFSAIAFLALAALGAEVGCSGNVSGTGVSGTVSEDVTGSTTEAIIDGNTVSTATRASMGLVEIRFPEGNGLDSVCSGVFIASQWAITAGHCVVDDGGDVSRNRLIAITSGSTVPVTQYADRIYRLGSFDVNNPTGNDSPYGAGVGGPLPDLALVHVAAQASGMKTTSLVSSTSTVSLTSASTALTEYGLGDNDLAGDGLETWRSAVVAPANQSLTNAGSSIAPGTLVIKPNSKGQVGWYGDSGGPYVARDSSGKSTIVAIQSGVRNDESQVYAVEIAPYLSWMNAAMATTWNSTATAQSIQVTTAEIATAPDAFSSLSAAPWYEAASVAARLCTSRNFIGGHFVGQQSGSTMGLVCVGTGSELLVVSTSDFAAAKLSSSDRPSETTTIGSMTWDRAARVANATCVSKGYVGGLFTGDVAPGSTEFDLLCTLSPASHLTARRSDLQATGFAVQAPASTSWPVAAQAAAKYCTNHGFTSGYLDGTYASQAYGVVCEK